MERHLWYCKTLVWKKLPTKADSNVGWNGPLCGLSCGSFDKLLECKASHSINQRGFSWRPEAECRMALKLMDERDIEKGLDRGLYSSHSLNLTYINWTHVPFYTVRDKKFNGTENTAFCFDLSNLICVESVFFWIYMKYGIVWFIIVH